MKKTMRKAVMAVVAATLALSPVSVFAEEPKEVTIGIAWPSLGTQAWSAMADYLRWYVEDYNAENEVQVKLIETTAGDDAAAQETQIRDLLNQDVDVVVSGAIDTTAIWSSITETHDAGKKFISFCRRLTPGGPEADSTVGPDTYDTAYVSVDAAIKKMIADGIPAEEIKIVRVQGDLKDQNAVRYGEGCEAAVKDNGATIVADIECNWSVETLMNKLAPTLQANTDAMLIMQFVLKYTTFGRKIVAVGSNPNAASKLGLSVKNYKLAAFTISGIFAGLGGMLICINLGSVTRELGDGYEFTAVAAIVLGGVSLAGGEGSVFPKAFIGVLILTMIENGLTMIGADIYVFQIAKALIIFVMMYIDSKKNKI